MIREQSIPYWDSEFIVPPKEEKPARRKCWSPKMRNILATMLLAASLVTAVYLGVVFLLQKPSEIWPSTCNIRSSYRVDCFPGRSIVTYDDCEEANCCWHDDDDGDDANVRCFHSIPSHHGYTPENNEQYSSRPVDANAIFVPRQKRSPLGSENVESLKLRVVEHAVDHLEIIFEIGKTRNNYDESIERTSEKHEISTKTVKFRPTDRSLGFPPRRKALKSLYHRSDSDGQMEVYVHEPEFSVTVTRNETSKSILTTARGPFIMTKNYWEFTIHLSNGTLYGLDQLELNGTKNWIYDNRNGTISRAAFLGISELGEAAACYVTHDGPMEIQVKNESNLIILRGISLPETISIDLFAGPTPLVAIRQLAKNLKNKRRIAVSPPKPGLHACPKGKKDELVESMKKLIDTMKENDAPWDSHCIHENFHSTIGSKMESEKLLIVQEVIQVLAKEGKILVPHLTPMVVEGSSLVPLLNETHLLLSNDSGAYAGKYHEDNVYYPDWQDEQTRNISLIRLNDFINEFGKPNCVFVRDSWPKDETKSGHPEPNESGFDYMPHELQSLMTNGTVPYNLVQRRLKSHYTEHASYSTDFHEFVGRAEGVSPLIISGLWSESGNSSWPSLRAAIRVAVGSAVVGQLPSPMYACGTGEQILDTHNELCSRWYGASVAWPYVLALPANLPQGDNLDASSSSYVAKYLRLTASLVTYANTVIGQFEADGSPILAPTYVYYPTDLQARHRPDQFMWGSHILVGLVTRLKVSQVHMWIPGYPDKYPWRHLSGGSPVYPTMTDPVSITAPESHIVTLIRPGSIIPIHEKISTDSSTTSLKDLTLVSNVLCEAEDFQARGEILYGTVNEGGRFVNMIMNRTSLKIQGIKDICTNSTLRGTVTTVIDKIIILGFSTYQVQKNFCDTSSEDTLEIALPTEICNK